MCLLNYLKHTKQLLGATLPTTAYSAIRKFRMDHEWYRGTAIRPDFARRIRLIEQRLDDPDERPTVSARTQRTRILMPGGSCIGKYETELASGFGVDVRDPTADARLLAFVLSVPDHVFMDPKTGMDRWLVREAMKGRVPDEVRLNRNRGRQSGDRVLRLRASKLEVDAALDELRRGPAAEYVDVDYMQQVWKMIQTDDTPEAFQKSGKILLRGIMAGLSIHDFYSQAG
jgi:asparagine synthase (glutamine-hydrolysing)